MLRPGVQLSRFRLVSVLGRGGMGEVWRAQDLRLGREVALKVLPETVASDPDRVARFEREARALAALNHPNVAQIYELGEAVPEAPSGLEAPPSPAVAVRFLVMELVEGATLARRLRDGALPLGEAARVGRQVGRALLAAHARGVIHRDLKPGNIMLTPEGEAKVLDFGLARFRPDRRPPDDVDLTAKLSDSGGAVGTAAYMAPEQVRGEECDESCDVWAFGCCLAEMLSGRRAFAGATVPDIVGKVEAGEADLTGLPDTTPAPLRSLLEACLATKRSSRPSVAEVVAALEDSATQTRTVARRLRRWWPWAAAGSAALALLAGAAWFVWPGRPSARLRPAGDARLRVVMEPVRPGSFVPPAEVAARVDGELLRAVTARSELEVSPEGRGGVRVGAVVEGGSGRERLRFTLFDGTTGAVLRVLEAPLGRGTEADAASAAAALAAALELEQVCRELEAGDPLHGFLARRTQIVEAARAFREALQLNARTRLREAKAALEGALKADPGFWPAHLYLALNAKATGHFGAWEGEIAQAKRLVPHPDDAEAVVLEEVAATLSEDSQRRLEALEHARSLFPASGDLAYRTAQTYRFQDRAAEAIPLLEGLLAKGWRPDWSPTREELAFSQLLAGRLTDVLRTTEEGEARFPTRYKYSLYAALALQQLGRPAEAREALRRAIRKHLDFSTTSPVVVHQTAQYWASLLRWDEERRLQAQAVLDTAEAGLRAAPDDGDLALARAEALVGLGRHAEAKEALEPLASTQPDEPAVFLARSRAVFGLGDGVGARAALERAGQLWRSGRAPALGTLAYNIAAGWGALGDADQAFEWLLRARDQYGADRLDVAMDPDLDPLRGSGLLEKLPPRR